MSQIFRVERTKNYTVMSNQHFKNKSLSLKAKGLLSLMLSLPDDWNYNMQGLASLSRDGIDSVRSAIKELEHHGYVQRNIVRNEHGLRNNPDFIAELDYVMELNGKLIGQNIFMKAVIKADDGSNIPISLCPRSIKR